MKRKRKKQRIKIEKKEVKNEKNILYTLYIKCQWFKYYFSSGYEFDGVVY